MRDDWESYEYISDPDKIFDQRGVEGLSNVLDFSDVDILLYLKEKREDIVAACLKADWTMNRMGGALQTASDMKEEIRSSIWQRFVSLYEDEIFGTNSVFESLGIRGLVLLDLDDTKILGYLRKNKKDIVKFCYHADWTVQKMEAALVELNMEQQKKDILLEQFAEYFHTGKRLRTGENVSDRVSGILDSPEEEILELPSFRDRSRECSHVEIIQVSTGRNSP